MTDYGAVSSGSRRRVLRALAGTAAVGLAGCTGSDEGLDAGGPPAPSEWSSFGADAANVGRVDVERSGSSPSVAWTVDVGGPGRSSPVAVDGTVFVGGGDGVVSVAADGAERWRADTDTEVTATPAVADGVAYAIDRRGTAYAIAGGDELWRASLREGANAFGTVPAAQERSRITASPTVVDGTVYAAGAGAVVAMDASDGTERWRTPLSGENYPADDQTIVEMDSTPAVADGTLYVGVESRVVALDASDGSEAWSFDAPAEVTASPAVVDDTVFVGSTDGSLHALAVGDGHERWRARRSSAAFPGDRQELTPVDSSPAVAAGTVVVGGGGDGIYAFDANGGDERWTAPASLVPAARFGGQERRTPLLSSPAVAGDTLYAGTDEGTRALSLDGGDEQWTVGTDAGVAASPAVANVIESGDGESTGVIVVDRNGTLYALT